MAVVIAKVDIRSTPGQLMLAKKGTEGQAMHGVTPAHRKNMGRVAVRWGGRSKVYWVDPAQLRFRDAALDPASYVATAEPEAEPMPTPIQEARPFSCHFGKNMHALRTDRKLSQADLATILTNHGLPVTQTAVSYWERAADAPPGRWLAALAQALDVPAFIFFFDIRDCTQIRGARDFVTKLEELVCQGQLI